MSKLETLISMGFPKERAERALTETDNADIEMAIQWLIITDGIDDVKSDKKDTGACAGEKSLDSHLEEAVHHQVSYETRETPTSNRDASNTSVNSSNVTRILVRLLNGKQLSKTFNASDKLGDVLLWIRPPSSTEQFVLMTSFPKQVFTSEHYTKTLEELNLVPSAVLIATQPEKWSHLKEYRGTNDDEVKRRVEEKRRKEEMEKRFNEMEEERTALARVKSQIEDDKAARRQRWPNLYKNSGQPSDNSQQMAKLEIKEKLGDRRVNQTPLQSQNRSKTE